MEDASDKIRNFTGRLRDKIINKFKRRCAICHNDTKYVKEVIDHWIPHNSGGKTLFNNGVLLCEQCNITKRDRNPFFISKKVLCRTIEIDQRIKERNKKNKQETINEIDEMIKMLENYKNKVKYIREDVQEELLPEHFHPEFY